jgi:putative salt-induced outer membrane protein
MANGDRLTGMILKSDSKELVLRTDYAGDINVQWAAVRELTAAQPIYIVRPDGTTVSGTVATQDGALVLTAADASTQRIALADAKVIRSGAEQSAYQRSLHPDLLQNWQADTTLGFALARGNSRTTSFSLALNAGRTTLHDKFAAYAGSLYASSAASVGAVPSVTANDIRGGARYDHDLAMRAFAFGGADFEYNEPQFLDLRSILTAGGGYHVLSTAATTLDAFAGLNYTRESYATGVRRNFAALTLGDTLAYKWGKSTTLTESFYFYPDLSASGHRFALDSGVSTKIRQWLAWQTSVSDRYLSNPIPGTRSNDVFLTTGFNFSLKR